MTNKEEQIYQGAIMKRNKYNAKSASYGGYTYDSKKEASYAMELDWLKKAGTIKRYERQHRIDLTVNGVTVAKYFVDFKVIYPDGREEFHEVKGFETDLWRLKWKLAKAIYPNNTFVLIK